MAITWRNRNPEQALRSTTRHVARRVEAHSRNSLSFSRACLQGDVVTEDLIQTWLAYKHQKELEPVQLRPHPYEFALHFDT